MTTTPTRNGAFPQDARSAAELYLQKGLAPIPLPPRSKDPGYAGWQQLRLTADALDQHFPPQVVRNIGILNGTPSGNALDVDLDCVEALLAALVLLPATGWVFGRTSAPRSHWLYRADRPLDTASEAFHDLDGTMLLELRGTGGLTVYPPSTHSTGERIAWERFTEPAGVPLTDLQRVVRELAAVVLLARHWPGKGSRQGACLALSGGLLRGGWAAERVETFLRALVEVTGDEEARKRVQAAGQTERKHDQDRKTTGWPRLVELIGADGGKVVRRVRLWLGLIPTSETTLRRVRTLEPYRPLPLDALPMPISAYVRQAALALGCDPAYLALPVLSVLASAIGNTRLIRLKRGWEEPSVVWTAIVGDSGTLKSPAWLKAVAYLFRLQKRLLVEFKEKLAQYQEDLAAYKEAKRRAKEEDTDPGDPPEEPASPRVVCGDTTIEKLAEILEDNPRGLLVARDELAGWLGSFTRYKGKQGGTDLPNWLEMHRAGTVLVDRKTGDRRTIFVPRAAVSVTGGIQPGVLARALTAEFLDAGLAARLPMAMPPKLPKRWSEAEVEPEVEQAYQDNVDKLLALDFDRDDQGEKVPHLLRLSSEAKTVWVKFYNDWAAEQAAAEGELAAAFSKLEAYAARFALIHHVVTCVYLDVDDRREVGPKSVEAGIALCRWFAHETRRIYTTLSESNEEREARRVVEFVQARGGRVTVKDLQRSNQRKYPTAECAETALDSLVQAGMGCWHDRPASPQGGRPTRDFVLYKACDETDETPQEEPAQDREGSGETYDDTDKTADDTCGFTEKNEVSSVSSYVTPEEQESLRTSGEGDRAGEVSSLEGEVSSLAYTLVHDPDGLAAVRTVLDSTERVGLDVETTGLDPRQDRIRLLSIATDTVDGGTFCYLVDCFAVDPAPLFELLSAKEVILHNAAFDLAFLARLGFSPGTVHDTMLLAQLLAAGTGERCTLAACVERELGRSLGKAGQHSDWSGESTDGQLAYAATDVEVLVPLYQTLAGKVKDAGLVDVARLEQRCLPAILWMSRHGVAFDRDAWQALARGAGEEAGRLEAELNATAPSRQDTLLPEPWNWNSPTQVKQALSLAGCELESTADEALATTDHPLAQLLRRYRDARKRVTTYGTDWLQHVAADGRVYTHWSQCGAVTGRMASGEPNLQNVPRDPAYRRCFRAPEGRVLVKADYSQIELRIAAKVAGEQRMINAYRRGEDLHALTARNMTGREQITPAERQLAKPVNFGLIYGLGRNTLRRKAKTDYGLDLSEEDAIRYRGAFFDTYPAIRHWHRKIKRQKASETRTLAGRRVLVEPEGFFGAKANYVVQGTGGDAIKAALALLWERRDQAPGAFPVLAVHDEIVVEADADQAEAVAAWLKAALVDALAPLIDPIPVEVEVKVARTWGGD